MIDKTYIGIDYLIQKTATDQIEFSLLQGGSAAA
jgi:hypothetical protein